MGTYREPFAWWGPRTDWDPDRALSITQLIANGMLDVPVASLSWLFVERKASLIVAALPRLAGKTTLLSALIALRPPSYDVAYTRGTWEDFSFLRDTDPSNTYVLCNEISSHLPTYLYGDKVLEVFKALDEGYSLGATMHAETAAGITNELRGYPLGVPGPMIARNLALIILLAAGYTRNGVLRRVREVYLVGERGVAPARGASDDDPEAPCFRRLGFWDREGDTFYLETSPGVHTALKRRLGLSQEFVLDTDLSRRQAALQQWMDEDAWDFQQVRDRVLNYYGA